MKSEITIRTASADDAAEILDIYSYYVENTAITFEYDVPSLEEFRERISQTLLRYPYIVAEKNGVIAGYAYAGVFKDRAAYDYSVEVTVYTHCSCHKQGLGRLLYTELEAMLRQMGITNLYACIGVPVGEADEYLDNNSMDFHTHMGYALAGRFHKCGYKFGRWYDMVWLEKLISQHSENMPEIKNHQGKTQRQVILCSGYQDQTYINTETEHGL